MKTRDLTITDAMANMGGMTILLAKYFKKVNACEIVPLHCDIMKTNVKAYGIHNVTIQCGDFMRFMKHMKQDLIFFDPPWGGAKYNREKSISLGINNVNIVSIINAASTSTAFAIWAPFNFDYTTFFRHLDPRYNTKVVLMEKSKALILIKT